MSKIFVVCGEKSGDLLASHLITLLKESLPTQELQFLGIGGPACAESGMEIIESYEKYAVMGIVEVLTSLYSLVKLRRKLCAQIQQSQPAAVILVDYPGFNLRLAADIKKLNIPIIYFVAPKVWASRPERIPKMKKLLKLLIVVFPFEKEFFTNHNIPTCYWQHPLITEILNSYPLPQTIAPYKPVQTTPTHIVLLPGSRNAEINQHLPIMLTTVTKLRQHLPNLKFSLIQATGIQLPNLPSHIDIIPAEQRNPILSTANLAIVASGTATLEIAAHMVPMVAIYKVSPLTEFIARYLIRIQIKYLTLVNILAKQKIIPELIQQDATPTAITQAVISLLTNPKAYHTQQIKLHELITSINQTPNDNIATAIDEIIAAKS